MKVVKLDFKTPGIFLDDQFISSGGELYLEFKQGNRWVSAEEANIKVVPEVEPNEVVGNIQITSQLKVPTRDEGHVFYYILLDDERTVDFRLVARNCIDCWDFYQDTGKTGPEWIIDGDRRGRIIVGSGTIGN